MKFERKLARARLGFLASALPLLIGCGAGSTGEVGVGDEDVGETQQAFLSTGLNVKVRVFVVSGAYDAVQMATAVTEMNKVYSHAAIEFELVAGTGANPPTDCSDKTLGDYGNTVTGQIAVFWCQGQRSGSSADGPNSIRLGTYGDLAHEVGHHLGLSHTFYPCWVPLHSDLASTFAGGDCPLQSPSATIPQQHHYAIEDCIKRSNQGLGPQWPCEFAANTPGKTIRDILLNGDGLADTQGTLSELPASATPRDVCDPNMKVPMVVDGVDYTFSPGRENLMGYLNYRQPGSCATLPAVTLSETQITMMRTRLMTGNRAHLIVKTMPQWESVLNNTNGFDQAQYYQTLGFPDVNNDKNDDLCVRGIGGILCATNTGGKFGALTVWNDSFSNAQRWGDLESYYGTIRYPDVSASGAKDVCGRGSGGIWCAVSDDTGHFTGTSIWESSFSNGAGWDKPQYWQTIAFPNIGGSVDDDLCARGKAGILCGLSNGSSFTNLHVWESNFSDLAGWDQPMYYRTIRYPKLNSGSSRDVCGRGSAGLFCAISDGSNGFTNGHTWSTFFSNNGGWGQPQYYETIQYADLNLDGRDDVCGRASDGIYCALSDGSNFGVVKKWTSQFGDGWDAPQYYSTIKLADVDGDGTADVCGRGVGGVYCAYNKGQVEFSQFKFFALEPSDANGWSSPSQYSTLAFTQVNKASARRELCGRSKLGILCQTP